MTNKWQRNDKEMTKTWQKMTTQIQNDKPKCKKNATKMQRKWQNNYFGISNVCRPKIFLKLGIADSPRIFSSPGKSWQLGAPDWALAMGRFTPAPSHFSHSLQSLHLSDPTKSEEERSIVLWWPTSSWNDAAELIDHDISPVRFMGSFKQVVNT